MSPTQIKNIFWDVDGVLADLNHAYFFPDGSPELSRPVCRSGGTVAGGSTHRPGVWRLGIEDASRTRQEMDRPCADQAFFRNRPLYPKVIETLQRLNGKGYRQFTMSATFDVEAKTAYLNEILAR